MVHGLPQRRRRPSPRCAATASGSSRPISRAKGWCPPPAPGEPLELGVATRSGVKRVRFEDDGTISVDLGPWRLVGGEDAARTGSDSEVTVAGLPGPLRALSLDLGNPHTVVALPGDAELELADLTRAPVVDPRPPHGTNVELVVVLGPGHIRMRVHERGVGETRSCGTGIAAAALATRVWAGPGAADVWRVDVPGGTLQVTALPRRPGRAARTGRAGRRRRRAAAGRAGLSRVSGRWSAPGRGVTSRTR